MPDRITQLNDLMRDEISQFFHDAEPEVFCTITRVSLTPDLREAHVWVSFLSDTGSNLEQLRSHLAELGKTLGKRLRLRRIPHITLHVDTGLEYSEHISDLLQQADESRSTVDDANSKE